MASVISSEVDQSIISRDPGVMGGEAVFPGTRVTVHTLQDYLTRGSSAQKFIADFPGVSREQVVQVLELAFESVIGPRSDDWNRQGG